MDLWSTILASIQAHGLAQPGTWSGRGMPMNEPVYYGREDGSAWTDSIQPYLTGLVAGCLMDYFRETAWKVEAPQGYAPVVEVVGEDGSRYRITVEKIA